MKIAQISPLWTPSPPRTYGGTEFIVNLLTEELVKRGHEITLFASGDSQTSGRLVPIWEKSLWRAKLSNPHAAYSLLFSKVIEMQDEFDIVHDHTEFYFAPFSIFIKKPALITLHRPLSEETAILFKKFNKIHYIPISNDQRSSCPKNINLSETILHGIPVERYLFNNEPDNYLLWFSKITPSKGILEAIELARKTGEKLIICGNIIPENDRFFKFEVAPLIDNEKIIYVGEADFNKKVELMRNAKALIYPIKRREPFGLVMVEAMACGTPVIASSEGSVPEIIVNKKTGFIVQNIYEMINAIKKIPRIKRINCRKHVEHNFNLERMVDAYEALYYKLLNR